MIIAPSLLVLSIYINVYVITIHIMPVTFGYIWLAVSATDTKYDELSTNDRQELLSYTDCQ
jgi:hypothetical protein